MSGIIPGFGTYLRRLWQRKPEQYDFDWAQYSVARNAERIGIDPASIVGYWPMWEGAGGTAFDVSLYGNHGTLGGPDWASNCVDFNASGDYISLSKQSLCAFGTGPFTILADAVHSSVNDFKYIFSLNKYDPGFAVHHDNNNRNPYIYDGGSKEFDYTLPFGRQTIAYVRYSTDTNGTSFFSNGVERDTLAYSANISTVSQSNIGNASASGNSSWGDKVYECLVATIAFTQDQIAFLHTHPYYLLQPVPRTIYFDYGASDSGATTETATLLSVVASTIHEPLVVQESGVLSQVPTSTLVTLDYVLGTWNRILRPDNSWSRRAFTPKTWSRRAFTPKTWSRN
jgi:hypothetical protein